MIFLYAEEKRRLLNNFIPNAETQHRTCLFVLKSQEAHDFVLQEGAREPEINPRVQAEGAKEGKEKTAGKKVS